MPLKWYVLSGTVYLSYINSSISIKVIQLLKRLSRNHSITIVVSIHQPSQDILHMFDTVYVLAKGGLNVYCGQPMGLRQHLIDSGIQFNDNQIPIEVMLRHSCNGRSDPIVERMVNNNTLKMKPLAERLKKEKIKQCNVINRINKRFFLKDLWLLLKRTMYHNYIASWKVL